MEETKDQSAQQPMMNLGTWLGRHQAFGLIAKRCSAADAECLKAIRDQGEYKQLGLSWEQFCEQYAGVSRVEANRQIHYLEEFGANYFRMCELMPISPETYRLIAGAVTEAGLECDEEQIALEPRNRARIAAAVKAARSSKAAASGGKVPVGSVRKRLEAFLADAHDAAGFTGHRLELIGLLCQGRARLDHLVEELRKKTLVI